MPVESDLSGPSIGDQYYAPALAEGGGVSRASTASGRGVTALPGCDAKIAQQVRPVVAIPITDSDPAVLSLVWRRENDNSAVEALVAFAGNIDGSRAATEYLSRA